MMARLIQIILVTCLLIISTHSLGSAQPIPPLDGLEALRKGFSGITDFTADITQEKRLSLMKRSMVMSGKVRFRKPDQFYMELNPPYSSRMLLKDSVIEQAGFREGERSRIILPPEQGLKRWFSKLAAPVTSLPEGVAIQADLTDAVYTLTIIPKGKGQVKELTINFLKDGTVKRLVISEQNGDRATMTFKRVRRNTGLTEADFRLEP